MDKGSSDHSPSCFPKDWILSNQRVRLADRLAKETIGSIDIVEIDAPIAQGMFGTRTKKRKRNQHRLLTICKVYDSERFDPLADAIKSKSLSWNLSGDKGSLENSINEAADEFFKTFPWTQHYATAFKWLLFTSALVVHDDSVIGLLKLKTNEEQQSAGLLRRYQFGIKAKVEIPEGVFIPELLGLMASDTVAEHSGLSEIMPHNDQIGPREPRILVGPLRFINHSCDVEGAIIKPNITWDAIKGTPAYVAYTVRRIGKDEELLADYGKDYFADEPGGCPCGACAERDQVD